MATNIEKLIARLMEQGATSIIPANPKTLLVPKIKDRFIAANDIDALEKALEEGGAYIDADTGRQIPNFQGFSEAAVQTGPGRRNTMVALLNDKDYTQKGVEGKQVLTNLMKPHLYKTIDPVTGEAVKPSKFMGSVKSQDGHEFADNIHFKHGGFLNHTLKKAQPAMRPSVGIDPDIGNRRINIFGGPVQGLLRRGNADREYRDILTLAREGEAPPVNMERLRQIMLPIAAAGAASQAEAGQTNVQKLLSLVAPRDAKGVRAFHGSFKDFDRFDDKFIGTGVGQNYGAGHYFSTDPTLAQSYRRRGLSPKSVQIGNTTFDPRDPVQSIKDDILRQVSEEFRGGKTAKLFNSLPPEGQRKLVLGIIDEKIIKAERTGQPEQIESLVKLRDELSEPGSVRVEYDYFGGNADDSMHEVELDVGPFGPHEFGRNTLKDNPFAMGPQTRPVMDILENMPSESLQKALSKYGYDIEGNKVREALFGDEYRAFAKKHQKELDAIDGDEYDKDLYLDKIGGWNQAQTAATRRLGDAGIPATAYPDSGGIRDRTINYVIHPGQTDRIKYLSKYAVPGAVAAGAAGQAEAGEVDAGEVAAVEQPVVEQEMPQFQPTPESDYAEALMNFTGSTRVSQQLMDETYPPNELKSQFIRRVIGDTPTYAQFFAAQEAAGQEGLQGPTFAFRFNRALPKYVDEFQQRMALMDEQTLNSVRDLAEKHFSGEYSIPTGRTEVENQGLTDRGLDPATTLTADGRSNHMHLRGMELIDAASEPIRAGTSKLRRRGGTTPEEIARDRLVAATQRYGRSNIPATLNPDLYQTVTPQGDQRFARYDTGIVDKVYGNQQGNNPIGQLQRGLQSFRNIFRDTDIASGSDLSRSEIARLRRDFAGLQQEPTPLLPSADMTPAKAREMAKQYSELTTADEPTATNDFVLGMQNVLDKTFGANADGTRPFAGKNRMLASESQKDIGKIMDNSTFDVANAITPFAAGALGAARHANTALGPVGGAGKYFANTFYHPLDDTVVDALISPTGTGAVSGSGYYEPAPYDAVEPRSGLTTQDENFDEGVIAGDARMRNNLIKSLKEMRRFSPTPQALPSDGRVY